MWIEREIEPVLRQRAGQRPVVVLTGARQTEKTSLVRRLFPEHAFVSLDLPSEADQAERDARSFLHRHPPPLVVDEVQYAPGLFRYVKAVVDALLARPHEGSRLPLSPWRSLRSRRGQVERAPRCARGHAPGAGGRRVASWPCRAPGDHLSLRELLPAHRGRERDPARWRRGAAGSSIEWSRASRLMRARAHAQNLDGASFLQGAAECHRVQSLASRVSRRAVARARLCT